MGMDGVQEMTTTTMKPALVGIYRAQGSRRQPIRLRWLVAVPQRSINYQ